MEPRGKLEDPEPQSLTLISEAHARFAKPYLLETVGFSGMRVEGLGLFNDIYIYIYIYVCIHIEIVGRLFMKNWQ